MNPTPEIPAQPVAPERAVPYYRPDPRRRSVTLAVILSGMPGLGQVYLGSYVNGFLHITVVAAVIAVLNMVNSAPFQAFLGLFLAFFWLFNMLDAGLRAAHLNQRLEGLEGNLPAGFPGLEERQGMLFAGVIIILVGILALAHLLLGLSFAWLEQWWPVGLILMGGYLVWRSIPRKPAPEQE